MKLEIYGNESAKYVVLSSDFIASEEVANSILVKAFIP
jgi:hypothetical protein